MNENDTYLHFILKDHLGSWTTITDASGNVEEEHSYDAWGNFRDPYTWTGHSYDKPMFDRGFTGHEHLYGFDLINMNGRMYDPVMSSFLSVDNYVQSPDNSQNFNRYAYCLNNPLKYTDPSGECIITSIIAGAFMGAIVNLAVADANGCLNTGVDFVNAASMGALTGAIGGAAGGAVGSAVGDGLKIGGFWGGAIIGGAGGAVGSAASASVGAWCTGASFGEGIWAGVKGSVVGGITGGLFGGLVRGFSDWLSGYDFWNGTKFIDFAEGVETLADYFPNKKCDSEYMTQYMKNIEHANYRLRTRTQSSFGDVESDARTTLHSELTKAMGNAGYKWNKDVIGTFTNPEGKAVFGTCLLSSSGYSETCISPFVATNPSDCLFEAVVAHELTHAVNYMYIPLGFNNILSEESALKTTASVFDYYGHHSIAAMHYSSGYSPFIIGPPNYNEYMVPSKFYFSPSHFPYRIK